MIEIIYNYYGTILDSKFVFKFIIYKMIIILINIYINILKKLLWWFVFNSKKKC